MKKIIIYRNQLFKPSEGFILSQTNYLTEFEPYFIGRKIENYELAAIQNTVTLPKGQTSLHLKHALLRNNDFFYQKIKDIDPKLIHAHFGVEGVYALPLAKKLNIPLITTFHGFDATTSKRALLCSGKISWINYLAFRHQLVREGDLIICVSNFIKNKLLSLGFPENKLMTHYIGVDTSQFKPNKKNKTNKFILHVARLVKIKGTKVLIDAFSHIEKKYGKLKLIIIGDGPLKVELEKYCNQLKLKDKVIFLGVQSHKIIIEYMQKATIFCMPSLRLNSGAEEGLGLVLLEAAACGLPVVATNHGGIPEVVIDDKTGLLVSENNYLQLADRLNYLLDNEAHCLSLGNAGRSFVESHFNLKNQTYKLENIYKKLLL